MESKDEVRLWNENESLKKEIAELKELHRIQLAGISVCLLQNTKKSASNRIDKNNPFCTPAYQDACDSIDREIKLIEQLETAKEILEKIKLSLGKIDDIT